MLLQIMIKIKMLNKYLAKFNELNKIIILNMMGMVSCKGLSVLVTLVLFPEYIRFFGNNQVLGVWFTILSVFNWLYFFDLGLGNGLRNKLPGALSTGNFILAKKNVSTTYLFTILLSVSIFVIFLLVSKNINWNILFNIDAVTVSSSVLNECALVIVSGILIQFILRIVSFILYAIQKPVVINVLGLISNFLILIILKVISRGSLEENLINMAYVNVAAQNLPLLLFSVWLFSKKLTNIKPSIYCFDKSLCKELLNIGLVLLWLQLVFLVVANTHEFLITLLAEPEDVVEYQAYFKVYNTVAIIFSFALTPVWSAVTKAQSENNYNWIKRIYKFFMAAAVVCFILGIILSCFVQNIFDIWLGNKIIQFKYFYGIIFSFNSFIFILHNVNTSIGNGLSYFRFQIIGMTIAAIVIVPLAYIFVNWFNSWIGVVLAGSVAILFYNLLAPYFTFKYIDSKVISYEYSK